MYVCTKVFPNQIYRFMEPVIKGNYVININNFMDVYDKVVSENRIYSYNKIHLLYCRKENLE